MSPSPEVAAFEQEYQEFLDRGANAIELVRWLIEEAEDPLPTLEAIGLLQRWLRDLEDETVIKAMIEGSPWRAIGQALGRSRQAVWERHHDPEGCH